MERSRVWTWRSGSEFDYCYRIGISASDDGALTLDEGLARFDCTIYREVEAGDHLIVLLQLHAVQHSVGQPLVFHRSTFGRLAG